MTSCWTRSREESTLSKPVLLDGQVALATEPDLAVEVPAAGAAFKHIDLVESKRQKTKLQLLTVEDSLVRNRGQNVIVHATGGTYDFCPSTQRRAAQGSDEKAIWMGAP